MGTVIQALVERGYGVSYRILDAQYFGVAQRRRRVFIVGCLGDDGRASAEVLSIVEGMRGHHSQSDKAGKETPRSTDASASGASWWDGGDRADTITRKGDDQRMPDKNRFQAVLYPKQVGTITTAFGAKNYSNHQELMEGSVVVYDELVHQESQSAER
jgi:DNA (cytosine-5)-methyltransferase 1